MTVLVAAVSLILSFTVSSIHLRSSAVATDRVRAQAAADAAALAAVAEGTIYGSASPEEQARLFAERNGGELIECDCLSGSYRVQVEVEVGEATAVAAAMIDPTMLMPADATSPRGLHPRLAVSIERLIAVAQGRVYLVSGFRSTQQQSLLWDRALSRYGSPEAADDWVAPPGNSMHERGLAVDLGGDLLQAAALADSLGLPLYRPLANEPWHFELVGSRR
mgnify:CR=1 FL=1